MSQTYRLETHGFDYRVTPRAPRCTATTTVGPAGQPLTVQCQGTASHPGGHRAGFVVWAEAAPTPGASA